MKKKISINDDFILIALNGEDMDNTFEVIEQIHQKKIDEQAFEELTGYEFSQLHAYGDIKEANRIIADLIPFVKHRNKNSSDLASVRINKSYKCYHGFDWKTYNPLITIHESAESSVKCIHNILNTSYNETDTDDKFLISLPKISESFNNGIIINLKKEKA